MSRDEQFPKDDDFAAAESPHQNLDETSLHVGRARDGDAKSLAWVVGRMTPLLLAQARFRIGRVLAGHYDPEDLVQDVWIRAIPKLRSLDARDGRLTPVLVRFLSSILLNRYRNLLDKHMGNKPMREEFEHDNLPAEQAEVIQDVMRIELVGTVQACIEELSADDREIVVLRAIEQAPLAEVAAVLRISSNAAAVRYHRALKRLRVRLPDSVFHELLQ